MAIENKRKLKVDIPSSADKGSIKAKAGEVVEVAENQERYAYCGLVLVFTKSYGGFCVRVVDLE